MSQTIVSAAQFWTDFRLTGQNLLGRAFEDVTGLATTNAMDVVLFHALATLLVMGLIHPLLPRKRETRFRNRGL